MPQKYTDPMYTRKYRKPICASVLGWAANLWPPKKGSFSEAVLEDLVYLGMMSIWTTEIVLRKLLSKKSAPPIRTE